MGLKVSEADIAEWRRKGLIAHEGHASFAPSRELLTKAEDTKPERKPAIVKGEYIPKATWIIGLATASETNERAWKARSARTQAARRAVSKAFGPRLTIVAPFAEAYHAGLPITIKLTRMGPRTLDRSNLPASLKAVEDAVALVMGCDDGSPLWKCEWEQVASASYGVVIALGFAPGDMTAAQRQLPEARCRTIATQDGAEFGLKGDRPGEAG